MSSAESLPRLALWPKRLIYLIYGVGLLLLNGELGLPMWKLALLGLPPIAALELVLALLLRGRLPGFEKRLMSRIQAGAPLDELVTLHRSQKLLRFAAPRHEMMGWLGLIYTSAGKATLAVEAYRQALEEAPSARAYPLALSLGDAQYEAGQWEEAEQTYRETLTDKQHSALGCANMARLILRRGGDQQEAEKYLRLAVDLKRGIPLRRELAELLLAQGKVEDARWQLQVAEGELDEEATDQDRSDLEQLQQLVERAEAPPDA